MAGKDVVEIYAQSPYTEYDKQNGVEKASVELVGYAKTALLAPGESETVTVTFNKDQLKAYDANGARTYIFDAGEYFVTAGKDAHDAVNNILAAKGAAEGNADLAVSYVADNKDTDVTTYAADSYSGAAITNQFDAARGDFVQLTRSDWAGTFPAHDGEVSEFVSTWGNEINGTDESGNPVSMVYVKTATADMLAQIDSRTLSAGHRNCPQRVGLQRIYHHRCGYTYTHGSPADDQSRRRRKAQLQGTL